MFALGGYDKLCDHKNNKYQTWHGIFMFLMVVYIKTVPEIIFLSEKIRETENTTQ